MIQADSLITLAGEAGKAVGTLGGAAVTILTPIIAQIGAWKKFPWPKKLRWVAALGVGAAGGAGILHDPLTGALLGALGGYGWGAIKSSKEWIAAGLKWFD
jgi:hypothetical protein